MYGEFFVADDWVVISDLDTQLVVPTEIAITSLRPDIVLWSRKGKAVVLCELTCPWEENAEWAHERKLGKGRNLTKDSYPAEDLINAPEERRKIISLCLGKFYKKAQYSSAQTHIKMMVK